MADIPPLPMNGTVTVEVERLNAFYQAMLAEAEDLGTSMTEILGSLAGVMVNFGGGGLVEGQAFQAPHAACQTALGQFCNDAWRGMMNLGLGAGVAAMEYQQGDASSAEVIAAINNAYAAPPVDPVAVERWVAGMERLEAQQRREDAAQAETFEDRVAEHRNEPGTGGRGSAATEFTGSDYYETPGGAYRDTVNGGSPYEIRIGQDSEQVSEVQLPSTARIPAESAGENAMSDGEFQQTVDEFPDRIRDGVEEELAEYYTPPL